MNISSSSLFRFTTKFDHLKETVAQGFGFRPCVEEMAIGSYENDPFAGTNIVIDELHSLVVCFCDLPLSQSKNHREQYGNYAIAMSKNWAMRRHITPIRYYHPQSPDHTDSTTRLMLDIMCEAHKNQNGVIGVLMRFLCDRGNAPTEAELEQLPDSIKTLLSEANDFMLNCLQHYWKTFHFTRIYEGEWTDRTTGSTNTRRFYDEREWRAVSFNPQERLKFQFTDVRHIIVTSNAERKELGELINSMADTLGVPDPMIVWSMIKLGDEIFPDA